MNRPWERWAEAWRSPVGRIELLVNAVVGVCVLALVLSVAIDFLEFHRQRPRRRQQSWVATGSMAAFFVLYYLLIKARVGMVLLPLTPWRLGMIGAGLLLIVVGCAVNVAGRFHLGANWANQVTLYADQRLVTGGVYAWVRHPLYASLIWMFYGGSLVFANYAAFLANALIFAPCMAYRARQEEALLTQAFPEYAGYRERTGRFFPKLAQFVHRS